MALHLQTANTYLNSFKLIIPFNPSIKISPVFLPRELCCKLHSLKVNSNSNSVERLHTTKFKVRHYLQVL